MSAEQSREPAETAVDATTPPGGTHDHPRAAHSLSGWRAGFDFAGALRFSEVRRQMISAGYVSGVTAVACEPDETIGDVLSRVAQVEDVDKVFVAMRDGDSWIMCLVSLPVRTRTTG